MRYHFGGDSEVQAIAIFLVLLFLEGIAYKRNIGEAWHFASRIGNLICRQPADDNGFAVSQSQDGLQALSIHAGHAIESPERSIDAVIFELDVKGYEVGPALLVFGYLWSDAGDARRFDELHLTGLEWRAAGDRGSHNRNLRSGDEVEGIAIGDDSERPGLDVYCALVLGQGELVSELETIKQNATAKGGQGITRAEAVRRLTHVRG